MEASRYNCLLRSLFLNESFIDRAYDLAMACESRKFSDFYNEVMKNTPPHSAEKIASISTLNKKYLESWCNEIWGRGDGPAKGKVTSISDIKCHFLWMEDEQILDAISNRVEVLDKVLIVPYCDLGFSEYIDLLSELHDCEVTVDGTLTKMDILREYFMHICGTNTGIRMLSADEVEYNPIPTVKINDSYGQAVIDVMFGKLQFTVRRPGDLPFPLHWRVALSPSSIDFTPVSALRRDVVKLGELSLHDWLTQICTMERKPFVEKRVEEWLKLLRGQGVDHPSELLLWGEEGWKEIRAYHLRVLLKKYVDLLRAEEMVSAEKQPASSEAERLGCCHNIKRFFHYHVAKFLHQPAIIDKMPLLEKRAIDAAFLEISQSFAGGDLLKKMREQYMAFTMPRDYEYVRICRGVLLYGPPGTGKTTLTDRLPRMMGFTAMAPPLASAEVNKSLVGQTEELLLDLLSRAHKFPHLICCISVDEIDGLAPRRDDKSSQSKNDALSILLSLIGGIKDVSNLVFMASTNRLKMMDSAFLRRMSAQLFVGRPGPDARRTILRRVNKSLSLQLCPATVSDAMMSDLIKWTTNFSGAALDALVSEMIVFANSELVDCNKKLRRQFVNGDVLSLTHKVSEQFSLAVGGVSLASIFSELLVLGSAEALISSSVDLAGASLKSLLDMELIPTSEKESVHEKYTGLMLVDLKKGEIIVETKRGEFNKLVPGGPRTVKELLLVCVNFATAFKMDSVQMFDMDLLLANAAFDDSKASEIIQEKLDECTKYRKSLAIVDLDALAGQGGNETSSEMGISNSSSVASPRMYSLLCNIMDKKSTALGEPQEQKVERRALNPNFTLFTPDNHPDIPPKEINNNEQLWVVACTASEFLLKRVVAEKMQGRITREQSAAEKEKFEEQEAWHRCTLCRVDYREKDNNKDPNCTFHTSHLFDPTMDSAHWSLIKPTEKHTQEAAIANFKYKKELARIHKTTATAAESSEDCLDGQGKFKYLCCSNPFRPHQGCRKDFHTHKETALDDILNVRREREDLDKLELLKRLMSK